MLNRSGRKSEGGPAATAESDKALSVIGAGMRIDGDCSTEGALRVEGHVTGNVHAARLDVVGGGRVDGDIGGPSDDGGRAGRVMVDGRVGGAVRADHVEVREDGVVTGGVVSAEAIIRGRVSAGVEAEERLLLAASGLVEGDVRTNRLAVEEGGQVNGGITMGKAAARGRGGRGKPERGGAGAGGDEEARSGQSPGAAPEPEPTPGG